MQCSHREYVLYQDGKITVRRPPLITVKISESAIASIGNGTGLSPEDLEIELDPGAQQLPALQTWARASILSQPWALHVAAAASGHCGSYVVSS
ncbi:hypothetical protein E4U12_007140 [Claviceps purpurea]|nr:hypothetical protein E4U12_007140 [Claviceps purpurea]